MWAFFGAQCSVRISSEPGVEPTSYLLFLGNSKTGFIVEQTHNTGIILVNLDKSPEEHECFIKSDSRINSHLFIDIT